MYGFILVLYGRLKVRFEIIVQDECLLVANVAYVYPANSLTFPPAHISSNKYTFYDWTQLIFVVPGC